MENICILRIADGISRYSGRMHYLEQLVQKWNVLLKLKEYVMLNDLPDCSKNIENID